MGLISPTWVFATIYKSVKWMVHGRNLHLMINDGLKIQMCFFRILKLFLSFFFRILRLDFLAHLSHRLRVSYCHWPMSVVRRRRQQLL